MKRFTLVCLLLFACPAWGQPPVEKGKGFVRPPPEVRKKVHAEAFKRHGMRMASAAMNAAPPAKFDCVELGWVPPVLDQGSCGSCYLVSTADAVTCAFIKAGYGKNDGTFKISDQYGMDCHNFGGCGGGWGAEVVEWMMKNGFPAERYVTLEGVVINDYPPYVARSSSCRTKAGAKLWKPLDWGFAAGDQGDRPATPAEIKAALMAYGTLNIAFEADNAYSNAGTKVVVITGRNVNHETTLVGWDDAKNAWKTRGNWGVELGDQGYVWMDYRSYLSDVYWVSAGASPTPPVPPVPPIPPIPPVPPVPPGPPVPVDFPLDVSGDTYIVVRTLPVEIRATLDGDFYDWSYPAGVSAIDKDKILKITAAPSGPLTINCKVSVIDWEAKKVKRKFSQVTIVIPPKEEAKAVEKPRHEATATDEPPLFEEVPKNRYADAYKAAQQAGKPLVIFVDCKPPASLSPSSYVVYECGAGEWWDLAKTHERGVIISVGGYRHKTLEPGSTIGQIEGEVLRTARERQVLPVPGQRSPTQIQWSFPGGRVERSGAAPFRHEP